VKPHTAVARTLAAAVALAAFAAAPRAASVVAPNFEGLVTRAQSVFVGQTIDVQARWVSTGSGRAIVTVVTFKVLRALKGNMGGQTQLEFLGGTVGEYRMEVPGIPRFRVGDEDVLFVDDRGQPVSPVVGFMHGRFRVLEEPGTGRRSVARFDFSPFSGVAEIGAAAPAARPARGPATAAARPMALADFEREIERAVRRQREAR
jgi:hypothetical protein